MSKAKLKCTIVVNIIRPFDYIVIYGLDLFALFGPSFGRTRFELEATPVRMPLKHALARSAIRQTSSRRVSCRSVITSVKRIEIKF